MSAPGPYLSIIIPTHNRPVQLAQCLTAIAANAPPPNGFEVIVVNDGGRDGLATILSRFEKRLDFRVHCQNRTGPAAARNAGARLARGRLLCFTDDDCLPDTKWLQTLQQTADAHPGQAVGGRTVNLLDANIYAQTSQVIIDAAYRFWNRPGSAPRFFATNNLAVPAPLFHELGGFNPEFETAEDRDFCDRWRYRGHQLVYASHARVYHAHRMRLEDFVRQHFDYGRGAYRYHQARARRRSIKMKLSPGSFYYHLFAYPLRQREYFPRTLLASLTALSQIASIIGFLHERRLRR